MSFPTTLPFGDLLKQLRKRAGMTQGDLAGALGYSIALRGERRPTTWTIQCERRLVMKSRILKPL